MQGPWQEPRKTHNCLLVALARRFAVDVVKNAPGCWDAFRTSLKDLGGPGTQPHDYIFKKKHRFPSLSSSPPSSVASLAQAHKVAASMPVITTSPQALSIACPHCKCNVWLHAMLAGFAPPRTHHGIPEDAEASDSAEDSDIGPDLDEDHGPAEGLSLIHLRRCHPRSD